GKLVTGVQTCALPISPHEGGHGVPGVGGHLAGGGVVAGDDDDVGAEVDDGGDGGVEGLDGGHLALEVAVLAGGVGVLVVQEEVRSEERRVGKEGRWWW